MNATLLALYKALIADAAVLFAVRQGKAQTLIGLYATADEAEAAATGKGQSHGVFEPTDEEAALIDLCCPPAAVKVDPMANRLRKSEVERPVQYVLRMVRENAHLDRKELIALCVAHGVADYTARTQVQVGLKRRKALAALQAQATSEASEVEQDEEQEQE